MAVIGADQEVVLVLDPVPSQPRAFRALPSGLENTEFSSPFGVDIQITDLAGPTLFCLWVFLETDEEGIPEGAGKSLLLAWTTWRWARSPRICSTTSWAMGK